MQEPLPHIPAKQAAPEAPEKPSRKLSRQTLVLLAVSLLSGVGAAWFARLHIEQHIQQHQRQQAVRPSLPPADSATVVRLVAARDLPAGVVLDADRVAVREFPAHLAASDSLGPEQYEATVLGRVLAAPLQAGDAILGLHVRASVLAETASAVERQTAALVPFSAALTPGRRAITLPIDEVNSAAGLLAPGDLIDLYVSFDHQHRRMTVALLQGVRVLATGQETEQNIGDENDTQTATTNTGTTKTTARPGSPYASRRYATITLDTSPAEALKLIAARQSGSITALLRQRDDQDIRTQPSTQGDLAGLLGLDNVPTVRLPPAAPRRIPIIYGDLVGLPPAFTATPVPQQTVDGQVNQDGAGHGGQ